MHIVYKGVLCERLKPLVKTLIGHYQLGFKLGKSTIDQIFALPQILKKTHKNKSTHYIFVDYKAAFDNPIRNCAFAKMSELGIPAKLIRLCRITLENYAFDQ